MIKIILNVGLAVALIAMSVSCAHIENSDVEFGIYLVENGELVLSDKYIKSYNKDTHEIELNEKGVQKWKSYMQYNESFDPPIPILGGLYRKEFIVKLNGKEIYRGKFYSSFSSMFENGVFLYDTMLLGKNNMLKVEFRPKDKSEKDPRNNEALIDYFRKKGILKNKVDTLRNNLGNVVNAQEQQPLKLIISPAKENYVSGDTALFSVSVQNTSDKPLRVLRYKKGGGDNYIWHDCTCIHSLFKGPKSDTIVLGPGEKYEFVLKEEQLSALDDSKRRIFILEYKMSDYRYFESEKPSWIDEVAQDSPLWTGFLKSNPVRINVENNCDELE